MREAVFFFKKKRAKYSHPPIDDKINPANNKKQNTLKKRRFLEKKTDKKLLKLAHYHFVYKKIKDLAKKQRLGKKVEQLPLNIT